MLRDRPTCYHPLTGGQEWCGEETWCRPFQSVCCLKNKMDSTCLKDGSVWYVDHFALWMFEWDMLSGTARRKSLPNRDDLKLKLSSFLHVEYILVDLVEYSRVNFGKFANQGWSRVILALHLLGRPETLGTHGHSQPPKTSASKRQLFAPAWQDTTAPQQRQQERGECMWVYQSTRAWTFWVCSAGKKRHSDGVVRFSHDWLLSNQLSGEGQFVKARNLGHRANKSIALPFLLMCVKPQGTRCFWWKHWWSCKLWAWF